METEAQTNYVTCSRFHKKPEWLGKDERKGPLTSVPPLGKHGTRKKRIKKSDPSRWGEQKTVQLQGRTVWWFLSKSNIGWQCDPAMALLVLPPKDLNTGMQTSVHTFKRWKQRNVRQRRTFIRRKAARPDHKTFLSRKKVQTTDICYKVDEPQKHHAQWNKPDTRGHMLYDSFYRKCPEENPERKKVD